MVSVAEENIEDLKGFLENIPLNQPFVFYHLPNDSFFHFMSGEFREGKFIEHGTKDPGFLVHPWPASSTKGGFISAKEFYQGDIEALQQLNQTDKFHIDALPTSNAGYYVDREEYYEQIEVIKKAIRNNTLSKVVLSRAIIQESSSDFNFLKTFNLLANTYPECFTYVLYLPNEGFWAGATPELLAKINNQSFETVALAGTLSIDKSETDWGQKEKEEHQIVVDHIENQLRDRFNKGISISGPSTVQSGPVIHLKTTFNVKHNNGSQNILEQIITDLHPTPAIAGFPQKKSIEKISAVEKHDRQFYTGFLGPVNQNNNAQLFINLRCFHWVPGKTEIFVGGGITIDSDPEKEWVETELKAQAMEKILSQF